MSVVIEGLVEQPQRKPELLRKALHRHYAGKADELMQRAAVGYQVATPLVAAAADAYATPAQRQTLRTTKKVLDRSLMNYAKGRMTAKSRWEGCRIHAKINERICTVSFYHGGSGGVVGNCF